MDWIKEFEIRFGNDEDINKVQAKKMHGSIQINFCDGHPVNYNLTIHRRSSFTFTTTTSSNHTSEQTLFEK